MGERAPLIEQDQSVVLAADGPGDTLRPLLEATGCLKNCIGACAIGPRIVGAMGFSAARQTVAEVRDDLKVIYNHQALGVGKPDIGAGLLEDVAAAGFDAVVLTLQGDPAAQLQWIEAAQERELRVIVDTVLATLRVAADMGVRDFWVNGNEPLSVLRKRLEWFGPGGHDDYDLYVRRLVKQSGEIHNAADFLHAKRVHMVIGRYAYKAATSKNPEAALADLQERVLSDSS